MGIFAKSFEISEYGNLLMYDRKYSAADVRQIIEKNGLNGLRIFDHWDPLPSLEFLREFNFLKQLDITCRYDHDFLFLFDLPQLEKLSVGPSFPMKNHVDLSAQTKLSELALQWNTNRISRLNACREVEDLCLIEFPNDDLNVISNLSKIKRLRIKTGRMKSLDGIENLKELANLEIGNCRRLRSVRRLNGLDKLRRMRIESCRKIDDLEILDDLPNLSTLQFVSCGEIPNLEFRSRFPKLERFDLLERTKLR